MTEETRLIYRCEYCPKYYISAYHAKRHEDSCSGNPANKRQCTEGCVHLVYKDLEYEEETWFGGATRKVNVLFCEKLRKAVYPASVEEKGNSFDGDVMTATSIKFREP